MRQKTKNKTKQDIDPSYTKVQSIIRASYSFEKCLIVSKISLQLVDYEDQCIFVLLSILYLNLLLICSRLKTLDWFLSMIWDKTLDSYIWCLAGHENRKSVLSIQLKCIVEYTCNTKYCQLKNEHFPLFLWYNRRRITLCYLRFSVKYHYASNNKLLTIRFLISCLKQSYKSCYFCCNNFQWNVPRETYCIILGKWILH